MVLAKVDNLSAGQGRGNVRGIGDLGTIVAES